jgi:ribonuclease D
MHRPTKAEIRVLPIYEGLDLIDIHIVENEQDAADALAVLNHEAKLGFDTETKPTFRKGEVSPGPTLIQLATASKAFLFPMRFPAAVSCAHVLLSNPNMTKVGFGIRDDIKELRNKLTIEIVNTQDLSIELKHLVEEKNNIGARAAVAMLLKLRLTKGAQTSNWGAYPLQKHQIQYAANDAHAAICVAKALDAIQKE